MWFMSTQVHHEREQIVGAPTDQIEVQPRRGGLRRRNLILGAGGIGLAIASGLGLTWLVTGRKSSGTAGKPEAARDEVDRTIGDKLGPKMADINKRVIAAHNASPAESTEDGLQMRANKQAGIVTYEGSIKRQWNIGAVACSDLHGLKVVMGANPDGTPNPDDPRFVNLTYDFNVPGPAAGYTNLYMATDGGRQYAKDIARPDGHGWYAAYVSGPRQPVVRYETTDDRPVSGNGLTPEVVADGAVQIATPKMVDGILSAFQQPEVAGQ